MEDSDFEGASNFENKPAPLKWDMVAFLNLQGRSQVK